MFLIKPTIKNTIDDLVQSLFVENKQQEDDEGIPFCHEKTKTFCFFQTSVLSFSLVNCKMFIIAEGG